MDDDELLARLSRLPPSLFEQVIFKANIPAEHLSSATAAQLTRALEVVRYVRQQDQLERLAQILEGVGGGRDHGVASILPAEAAHDGPVTAGDRVPGAAPGPASDVSPGGPGEPLGSPVEPSRGGSSAAGDPTKGPAALVPLPRSDGPGSRSHVPEVRPAGSGDAPTEPSPGAAEVRAADAAPGAGSGRFTPIYGIVVLIVVLILAAIALVYLKSQHNIDAKHDTNVRPDANARPDANVSPDADVRHDADIRHDAASPICGAYDSPHAHAVGDDAVVMTSEAGPLRYPSHGRIADFEAGQGAEARTVFNQQISLLSDSAWRWGRSKAWYERIDESGKDGPGILRLSFELSSRDPKQPRYMGIYFDFSFPPPASYDVSQFHGLALSLKMSNTKMEVEVRIILFSANVCNSSYAFPTYTVPKEDLLDRWREIKVKFDKFGDPPWYPGHGLRLDPRRVYRVAIVVISPKKDAKGYIELDDLRFVE